MIKRLWGCVREYRGATIASPIFITCEVILEVIIPFLMASLIDNGIEKGDMAYILKMGGWLVLCALLSLLAGAGSGAMAAKASTGFAANLRHDIYYKVQSFSFSNIDRFSTAGLVTRLTTDVSNVQNAFQMIIRIAVRAPGMLIFALIMAFRIHSGLALVFLCAMPILAVGLLFIMKGAHPIFRRVFKTYDRLNNVVSENLNGIRVVKSFVREDHEIKKFTDTSTDIYNDFSKAQRIIAFNAPLMQFCVYGCMLVISWLGAQIIVSSGGTLLTTGGLMSLITYVMQILMSLMMVSMVFLMITMSRASAERISEVLTEQPDITDPANPIFEVADGSISFEDVSFSYARDPEKLCLSDVNINIKSGQTVGIIGVTGASKTTLVQLIPRLYDATRGVVKVGGRDVREYSVRSLRDSVAMVLQKNVLFSGTIKENLRWGNEQATDEEIIHACQLAQADGFIREFPEGYDTHIEQGGTNVSGGQKQRLCIARALLKNPKILILDDSTSAVDTRTDALIRRAFAQSIPNTTKIIIAQRIASVMDADLILVMDGGRIEAAGSHEELMSSNEVYREVYSSQTKGGEENGNT